jgi:hypothetical protein
MKIRNRALFTFGVTLVMLSACALVTGCGVPTFLTDLESIIPIAGSAIAGLLAILGAVDPGFAAAAAAVQVIVTKVDAELTVLNTLIADYKSNPSDTVLEQIESGVNEVVADLKSILTTAGLPDGASSKIQLIVQAVVTQLEALLSVIPVLKGSTAGQTLPTVVKPVSASAFKAQIHAVLTPAA